MRPDGTDGDEFVVVGGGIGGLSTALALARDGWPVRVLERAPSFAEVGAGLQLAPNATRLLDAWGLLPGLLEVGVTPRRLVLADALRGGELASLDLTGPFVRRYGAPYVVAHRGDLLDLLLGGCRDAGVVLEAGRDVIAAEQDRHGATVRCADGTSFRCAAVVAADGLHSRLRAMVVPDEPICSGYVAYRGAVPIDRVTDRAALTDVIAFIGPGLHFVQYPLRGGALYNQVAVFRSERYRQGEPDWGGPDELAAALRPACAHVRGAARALRTDARWAMYDREPIATWLAGERIVLTGDAAHPMLQYLAQGACQALEDAGALAGAVREAGDIPSALRAFARQRFPRTARIQRNARIWGDIWHTGGVTDLLRNALFAHRGPRDFTATDWLYGRTREQLDSSPAGPAAPARPAGQVPPPATRSSTGVPADSSAGTAAGGTGPAGPASGGGHG